MASFEQLVPALPKDCFNVELSAKDPSILEITHAVPKVLFKANRLTASSLPAKERLKDTDSRVVALKAAGTAVLQEAEADRRLKTIAGVGTVQGKPLMVKLPFNGDPDTIQFVVEGYPSPFGEMKEVGQGLFLLTVTVEDIIKPRHFSDKKAKMKFRRASLSGDEGDDDEDDYDDVEAEVDKDDFVRRAHGKNGGDDDDM